MPGVEPRVSPCNINNLSDHYLLQHLALASSQFESGETHYQQLQSCVSLREAKGLSHVFMDSGTTYIQEESRG